ncbi:hypothetical protein SUGI_0026940 [Cryptomeria japonica]|nr:hypothetical protein SUGI_0026940 [Cryptomeria japonica]
MEDEPAIRLDKVPEGVSLLANKQQEFVISMTEEDISCLEVTNNMALNLDNSKVGCTPAIVAGDTRIAVAKTVNETPRKVYEKRTPSKRSRGDSVGKIVEEGNLVSPEVSISRALRPMNGEKKKRGKKSNRELLVKASSAKGQSKLSTGKGTTLPRKQ